MQKDGIKILRVKNPEKGFEICKNLLYENASKNSVFFLSGGSTPKTLYELLAKEKKLSIGAAALVDERYIPNSKLKSPARLASESVAGRQKSKAEEIPEGTNEKMIRDTGLVQYIENTARFYPILEEKGIEETAKDYDETVRFLFSHFPKSVGILGIGADGHTAGLRPGINNSEFIIHNSELVTHFEDFPGDFKKRITLTFPGLSKLDKIIILAFGREKKKALRLMFNGDNISEIPARFFKTRDIAEKTTLITDLSLL